MSELKACPFCGKHAVHVNASHPKHGRYVMCFGCFAATCMCDSPETAGDLWNIRPPLAAPTEAEVEACVNEMRLQPDLYDFPSVARACLTKFQALRGGK